MLMTTGTMSTSTTTGLVPMIEAESQSVAVRQRRAAMPAVDDGARSTEAAAPATEPARAVRPISGNQISLAEVARNAWRVYVGADVAVTDLGNPQLWFGALGFKLNDMVEIVAEDWCAWGLVTSAGPGRTTVEPLFHAPLGRPQLAMTAAVVPDGYQIRAARPGARSQFEVYRPHDNVIVSSGTVLSTYDDATRFAVEFVASLHRDAARVAATQRR